MVCFNGEFVRRSNSTLKKSSGLMVLDFDNLEDPISKKNELKKDPSIFSCWISPSGAGVKALLRIHEVSGDQEFKRVFKQVQNKFKDLDISGKDIARACFESYDPEIYVNLNAKKFEYDFEKDASEINLDIGTVTNIPIVDQDCYF